MRILRPCRMVRFPGDPKPTAAVGDVFGMLELVERNAQRDAETLGRRADPYAKARMEITFKVLDEAREIKQRLAQGQVELSEAATVATDLHNLLLLRT